MNKKILSLLIIFIVSCSDLSSTTTPISTSSTTSTIPIEQQLLIKNKKDAKLGVVRIVVEGVSVEPSEDGGVTKTQGSSSGTGFFISTDGYIVTNNHVIAGGVAIKVYIGEERNSYKAKVIGSSECDDIAIIKIDLPVGGAFYFDFADSSPVLGEDILTIGFPRGDEEITYLDGIVSKEKSDGSNRWSSIDYAFEHTSEILPGSSGGPIINENGEVVGIAYQIKPFGENVVFGTQEYGIPSVVVKNTISEILNNNFLGTFGIDGEQFEGLGLYVHSVEPGSPFDQAKFDGGELITSINNFDMTKEKTMEIYCNAIKTRGPDAAIKFLGIDLEEKSEFEAKVSLDGSTKLFKLTSDITTTTKPKTSANVTTTTTPKSSSKPSFPTNVLNMWFESFDMENNRNFSRWENDFKYSINGSPQDDDSKIIQQTMELMNSIIPNINIKLTNEETADWKFYFLTENEFQNYGCSQGEKFYNSRYSYRGNKIVSSIICFKIGQEYLDDFKDNTNEQTKKECRVYHLRSSIIFVISGGSDKNADQEKYGDNNYFSSPYCNNFQKISDLDIEVLKLHYYPFSFEFSTIDDVYNYLK